MSQAQAQGPFCVCLACKLSSDGGSGRWRGDFWNEHVLVCCGRIFPLVDAVRRARSGALIEAEGAFFALSDTGLGVGYDDAGSDGFVVRSRNFQYFFCRNCHPDSALLPRVPSVQLPECCCSRRRWCSTNGASVPTSSAVHCIWRPRNMLIVNFSIYCSGSDSLGWRPVGALWCWQRESACGLAVVPMTRSVFSIWAIPFDQCVPVSSVCCCVHVVFAIFSIYRCAAADRKACAGAGLLCFESSASSRVKVADVIGPEALYLRPEDFASAGGRDTHT
jgi:hypothetical protein